MFRVCDVCWLPFMAAMTMPTWELGLRLRTLLSLLPCNADTRAASASDSLLLCSKPSASFRPLHCFQLTLLLLGFIVSLIELVISLIED